jgi:hypothetical protein
MKYISPVSMQKVNTCTAAVNSDIFFATAASTEPLEIPTKIPSSFAQGAANLKASSLPT